MTVVMAAAVRAGVMAVVACGGVNEACAAVVVMPSGVLKRLTHHHMARWTKHRGVEDRLPLHKAVM